jgi:saccharopine dehydrogenase (NAD+, L-lysine forming)
MNAKIKLGIIREMKVPQDRRVPLSPIQCKLLKQKFSDLEIYVQSSSHRCFNDQEYLAEGINVLEDIGHCDIFMGVKEVPYNDLISNKHYFFFSHTIKKQPYNKKLLKEILRLKITLTDYECLKDKNGARILGFGRYAGIVGAYNGIRGYGLKHNAFFLKPAYQCPDRIELDRELQKVKLPPIKIVVTGGGRVANGVLEIMEVLNIQKVSPEDFIHKNFQEPVFCQVFVQDYIIDNSGNKLQDVNDFFQNPINYKSNFLPFTKAADILITAHFWDPSSPVLFTKEDMRSTDFKINTIADITCDIEGSVPSTLKASSIEDPFYGYDPVSEKLTEAFGEETVTVMAVDNLPCELPRDASADFGSDLVEHVFPVLLGEDPDQVIARATIAKDGFLTHLYNYLSDYAEVQA